MRNYDRLAEINGADIFGLPTAYDVEGNPVEWEWPDYGLSVSLDQETPSVTFSHEDVPEARLTVSGDLFHMISLLGPESTCATIVTTFADVARALDAHEAVPEAVAATFSAMSPDLAVVLA